MKFQIVGADRETGEDVEIVVDARDEVDAETIANRRNIIVSSVVLVRSLPPEPQQSPSIGAKTNVKQCPKCKEWINKGATKCPHCRSTQPVPPWTYAIAALLVIGPALWCCGPCSIFDQYGSNAEFEQVGYFKSERMRGFTFFVPKPNKADIRAFCQKKKSTFPSGRILKIHFFDDRANTPDVTLKYYFPEWSDPYLVADYFFNPFNGKQGLKIHKDIPD